MSDEWYYVDDDSQQVGPSMIPELRTLFKQKIVDDNTFFWKVSDTRARGVMGSPSSSGDRADLFG